jgi:hypothetical protein
MLIVASPVPAVGAEGAASGAAAIVAFQANPGAGGGSFARGATQACAIAPNVGSIPSNPGTTGSSQPAPIDSGFGRNGAVEIWIFTNGC